MNSRLLLATAFAFAACSDTQTTTAPEVPLDAATSAGAHHAASEKSHGTLPQGELARLRRATARYHDIQNAFDDQYVDINVVIPNMGRHLLKTGLLDATFEDARPELLVYSPNPAGRLELVAVEYAVPLGLSANAPGGFQGSGDEWFANQQFQLWTLHAWVWRDNPDGVFHATNSRVP
jgi:hypothetical protein